MFCIFELLENSSFVEFSSFEKMKQPGNRDVNIAIGLHQDRWWIMLFSGQRARMQGQVRDPCLLISGSIRGSLTSDLLCVYHVKIRLNMRLPCNSIEINEPISSICLRETYVPPDVIQSSRNIPMIITSCQPPSTQWDFRWLTSATNPLYNNFEYNFSCLQ